VEDLTAKCISSEQLLEAELRKFQEMQENHVARETNERSRFTDIVNAKDLELEQLKQQLRELQMQSELNKTAETRQLSAENMDLRRSIADLQGALRGAQLENEEAHVQGRAEKEMLSSVLRDLEEQLSDARQAREHQLDAMKADREVLERALSDLELELSNTHSEKEQLRKGFQNNVDKLTSALHEREHDEFQQEKGYNEMRQQLMERDAEAARITKELRSAESRWAKQKAVLVGEVEHLKQQGEMLLADLMMTTDSFQFPTNVSG